MLEKTFITWTCGGYLEHIDKHTHTNTHTYAHTNTHNSRWTNGWRATVMSMPLLVAMTIVRWCYLRGVGACMPTTIGAEEGACRSAASVHTYRCGCPWSHIDISGLRHGWQFCPYPSKSRCPCVVGYVMYKSFCSGENERASFWTWTQNHTATSQMLKEQPLATPPPPPMPHTHTNTYTYTHWQ